MATIKATLRKKKNRAGLYPIVIRITKDRKSTYLYTGQYIDEKYWDEKNNKVKKSHPNVARLNNYISVKITEANNSLIDNESKLQKGGQAQDIKRDITNKYKKNSFFYFAESHFKLLEKNKKFSRINSERPLLNRIKNYHNSKELDFNSITPFFLKGFIAHLKNTDSVGDRSIANTLIFIRTLFNGAINQGLVDKSKYPFGNGSGKIRIKIPESIKIGLTIDEVKAIEALDLENHQAQKHTRNVWMFSFYLAGMRVADVLKMKWSNIQNDRIYYRMNKNNKPSSFKINEKLAKIISEYESNKQSPNDYIFPELKLANQKDLEDILRKTKTATKKLNRYLSQITEKAEITKKVTFHTARRSFGLASVDKIPIQILQRLYNHSSVTTTIQYQQGLNSKAIDDALDDVIGF
ncbi:tyrosine-type recombinase/integrase [Tenacibaculum sp. TC6]|uniref:tyrosine-type recombinase/integrase n=1 Tax=Tenacibaculum sp. TC6 TaxID=3423223 RepID=UPI003D367B38